jgi:hypothetical protein
VPSNDKVLDSIINATSSKKNDRWREQYQLETWCCEWLNTTSSSLMELAGMEQDCHVSLLETSVYNIDQGKLIVKSKNVSHQLSTTPLWIM